MDGGLEGRPARDFSPWGRKQAELSHCSDCVDDAPVFGNLSFVVDPHDVHGLHFEGFSGSRHVRDESSSSVPRYVARIATLSPAATMSWISAVMSRFLIFTGVIVVFATAVIIATKGQLGRAKEAVETQAGVSDLDM
jgi:hypothetical protein